MVSQFMKGQMGRRGWSYVTSTSSGSTPNKMEWCPLCKRKVNLVIIHWMHDWHRCEFCLMKLPVENLKIKRMLGIDKPREVRKLEQSEYWLQIC